MPLVFSCKNLPDDCDDIIYVGRPRAVPVAGITTTTDDWGNPFRMTDQHDDNERSRVIECYKGYLLSRPDLIAKARHVLRGKRLACWCTPEPCHADVLCAFANSLSTLQFMAHIYQGGAEALAAIEQYSQLGIPLDIQLSPDPEHQQLTGTTALGIAAKTGQLDVVQTLIKRKDIDLNQGRGSSSPLLLAAAYGHVECVRALVRCVSSGRVHLNAARRDGVGALAIACQQGNASVVRLLLRKANGQFSKIKTSQRTLFPERVTPLLLAIRCGSFECVQCLLEHPGLSLDDNVYHRQTCQEIAKNMNRDDIVALLNGSGGGGGGTPLAIAGETKEDILTATSTAPTSLNKARPQAWLQSNSSSSSNTLPTSTTTLSSSFSSHPPSTAASSSVPQIPYAIQMNKMCQLQQQLPIEVHDWVRQQYHTDIRSIKSLTKGWHEVYYIILNTTSEMKISKRLILRIYRNELSYWKFNETCTSAQLEQQAAHICHQAGIPTPKVLTTGTCTRQLEQHSNDSNQSIKSEQRGSTTNQMIPSATATATATWSLSEYVPEFQSGVRNSSSDRNDTKLSVLRALYLYDAFGLVTKDGSPVLNNSIPSFSNHFEHLDYLEALSHRYGGCSMSCHLVKELKQLFHQANVPIMKSCLVHFDMHEGNVSMKAIGTVNYSARSSKVKKKKTNSKKLKKKKNNQKRGLENVKALIDWEFGGLVDPRLDLIKYTLDQVRHIKRTKRKQRRRRKKSCTNGHHKRGRSNSGSNSSGSSGGSSSRSSNSDSSSGSENSGSDSEEDDMVSRHDEDVTKLWNKYSKIVYAMDSKQVGEWFPFAALIRVIDVVFYRAVVRLLSDGPSSTKKIPFCDLRERGEDARRAGRWLVHHEVLDISKFPAIAYSFLF